MIGGPDLYPVKTRLLATARRLNETVNRLLDLHFIHGMATIAVMIAWPAGG